MFLFTTAVWFWMMLATVFQPSTALPSSSLVARQGSCMSLFRPVDVNPVHTGRQEITQVLRAGHAPDAFFPNTEIEVNILATTWPQNNLATFTVRNEGVLDQVFWVEGHLEGPAANHPNVVLSESFEVRAGQVENRCLHLPAGHRWYIRATRGTS